MCGVVDFVGITLPRCLGSAPRLLGRVRLLLRSGSSERSVGTFEWVPRRLRRHAFSGPLCTGVSSFAYLQLMFMHRMHLYGHVRMRHGYVSLTLRSAVSCPTPHLGVLLSWFFVARLEAS